MILFATISKLFNWGRISKNANTLDATIDDTVFFCNLTSRQKKVMVAMNLASRDEFIMRLEQRIHELEQKLTDDIK